MGVLFLKRVSPFSTLWCPPEDGAVSERIKVTFSVASIKDE